jgi:transglutaminase-like putative cysteine protease
MGIKRVKWVREACCVFLLYFFLCGCGVVLPEEAVSEEAVSEESGIVVESREETVPSSEEEEEEESEEEPESTYSFLWQDADSYAFNSLSEAEQIWYADIAEILGCFEREVPLSEEGLAQGLDETAVDGIFQCVLNDHPELFYVEGYSYTKYTRGDEITAIDFSGTYNVDYETALSREQEITEAAEQILAGAPEGADDYDKVKYVYETIILGTDYLLTAPDNQNIYSVFVGHASVCQGYAKATQYLLNRLGVECTLVLGTVESGEGHAWNLVKENGSYYYVDTTWGDASYQLAEEEEARNLTMPDINYDYLNVTTAELLKTHTIGSEVPMPACISMENNYYVVEGAYFTTYDRDQMSGLFERARTEGREDVTVKCADEYCYTQVISALIEQQEIFNYLTNSGSSIAYAQNDAQLSLTFWVTNE